MAIPLLSPVRGGEALAAFAKAHDTSVIVLGLWFWGAETLPARYLRALRTKLPHVKLVIMSDDVHHKRLQLAAEDEGRAAGKQVSRTREEELKWLFHADHVLVISEKDKQAILTSLPPNRAMHPDRFSTLRHVYAEDVLFPMERRVSDGVKGSDWVGDGMALLRNT